MIEQAAQLEILLSAELATLKNLKTTLEDEHQALLHSEVGLLEDATEKKHAAAQAHRQQQDQRLSWMGALGISLDASLTEIVAQCGDVEANAALQRELSALASDCQESNRRNGGLIIRLQERAKGALAVLRRDDARPDLYSLSGSKEHQSDSRTLGKA